MLYTIWTGVFIATATLLSLMRFDSTVEMSLTHGPQIIAERNRLTRQTKAQQAQIETNNGLIGQQVLRIAQQTSQLTALQTQITALQGQLAGTRTQLARTTTRLNAANVALNQKESDLKLKGAELLAAGADLKLDSEKLAIQNHRLLYLTARNRDLAAKNTDLARSNTDLDRQRFKLGSDVAWLQGAPIAFHKGQELGRREFSTDQPVSFIHKQLDKFVADLSVAGQDHGLVAGKNGLTVQIVSMPMDTASGAPATDIDEAANLDALAASIAELGKSVGSVVVIAMAHNNTTRGEQAMIDLHPYNNVLVFPRGAVIATAAVDGSQSENGVLASLQDFLVNQVKPEALKKGIIPTHDPISDEETVGPPISQADWTELVRQIRSMDGPAKVTAAASEDTYSTGPLRLTLTATIAPDRTQRATTGPADSPSKDRQISDGRTSGD
jgi:hypothetical protein